MSAELVFLAILLVGIVLMGVGVLRYRGHRGPRYRDRFRQVGGAGSRVAGYIGRTLRSHGQRFGESIRESRESYDETNTAYQEIHQAVRERVRRGEITEAQASVLLRRTLSEDRRYVEGTQGARDTFAHYQPGGSQGAGIYGENSRGVYTELKDLLESVEIGHPMKYVQQLGDLLSGLIERRRRRN